MMQKPLCCLLSGLLLWAAAYANEFPVASLPATLTQGADMVNRYDEMVIEIQSPSKARFYRKYAHTILNGNADSYAVFYQFYDQFYQVENSSGTLYDAFGKELKRVKKKDMEDRSGTDESSLMTDQRYKRHDFYYRSYPYTVAYEQESEINGLFNLPRWMPQPAERIAVEYTRLVVITPKNYVLRYKQFHYSTEPVVAEKGEQKTYTWEIRNLPPRSKEPYSPAWNTLVPLVLLAPSTFEIQDYKGEMDTWQGLGKFIGSLLQGKDALPEDTRRQVHTLTDGLSTDAEKVKVLYDFLQKNTRYISIQLGIGGWQPFDAAFVVNKRYGDCKALSNYMVALLKEAGIRACYAIISAGEDLADRLIEDFPSNQFNHATVMVPLGKDSIWLECTSQTQPAGYIGGFTGNRTALLIDETGGRLVHTTCYGAADNTQYRSIHATLDETGKLTANVQTRYSCMQQDDLHEMINGLTKQQQAERLKRYIHLPTYDIPAFSYQENKSRLPFIDETLQLVADNYATVSGKRLFVTPNVLALYGIPQLEDSSRTDAIVFDEAYLDIDSVQIALPAGYTPEAMPRNVVLSNRFGSYSITFRLEGNTISMVRRYEAVKGCFSASDYQELVAFFKAIRQADRSRLVLVKKA